MPFESHVGDPDEIDGLQFEVACGQPRPDALTPLVDDVGERSVSDRPAAFVRARNAGCSRVATLSTAVGGSFPGGRSPPMSGMRRVYMNPFTNRASIRRAGTPTSANTFSMPVAMHSDSSHSLIGVMPPG
jgi:hypothetical protein